jgi:serine/threonine protein kinase/Flp pilus assembly protein TadD
MEISPEQWESVKELYEAAAERDPTHRADFLRRTTTDNVVREEVRRLLAEHDLDVSSFLSTPPFLDHRLSANQSEKRFAVGEVLLERFRILSFIAAGGMGEVYEVEDLALKENLAIKTIRLEALQQKNALERFKREVHLARKVTHPNICRVFDLFWHKKTGGDEESAIVFVSMELLHGETLSERIRRAGRFSPEQALPVINQIASGLEAAHRAGVVHRDLKPGNVILVSEREQNQIRSVVTDFGLALYAGVDGNRSIDLTATQGAFGTPAYMSPEQIEGRAVTKLTDIYALGLIIYEMVTGEHAFPADTPLASAAKRLSEPIVSPKRFAPELSDIWEQSIIRCLQRDPRARYSSASDVAKALSDQKPNSSDASRVRKLPRYSRMKRIAVVLVLVAITGTGYQFRGWLGKSLRSSNKPASKAVTPGPVRIAVLPFHNISGSSSAEYLSDSIAEELIGTLGQAHGDNLRVLAKGSCLQYRETTKSPSEIAKELSVQYLVIGTVSLNSQMAEVNVQLVNGSDQGVIWAEKYSSPEGQLSQVQVEVADSVAREVQVSLLPQSAISSQIGGTSNRLAHDAYLHGRLDLERKNYESSHRALQEFHNATVLDPKYALAYAGLSELYINFANNTPTGPAYAYAKESALTAIRLDDRLAEAHRDLAWILDNNEFNWVGAEREYRRALELNPSDARAHHWFAQHLVAMGNTKEAIYQASLGMELDPLSEGSNYNYAFILMFGGQSDSAIQHLQAELLREPNSEVVYGYLGMVYRRTRDYEKSIQALQRAVEVCSLKQQYEAGLAVSLAMGGRTSEAQRISRRLRRQWDSGVWIPAYNLALMYFSLGNKNEGFRFLRLSLKQHSCTLLEINTEPLLLALRGDPLFEAIRREFHLAEPIKG